MASVLMIRVRHPGHRTWAGFIGRSLANLPKRVSALNLGSPAGLGRLFGGHAAPEAVVESGAVKRR